MQGGSYRRTVLMRIAGLTPIIIVDTREQKPYKFRGMDIERKGLATGDYSLKGHESKITVERKSHDDAWNSARGSRKRFVRCLQRLAVMPHPAIVIECSLEELAIPPEIVRRKTRGDTRLQGAVETVVGSFISWAQQYRIPVFFGHNRQYSERLVVRFLMSYWKHEVLAGEDEWAFLRGDKKYK